MTEKIDKILTLSLQMQICSTKKWCSSKQHSNNHGIIF